MADTTRVKTIAVWILSVALAALYLFAGIPKLMGAASAVEGFARLGYPGWFRVLIGLLEVAAGIGLLIPRAAFYAAGVLGVVMIGAAYTHVTSGTPGTIFPILCLALLTLVAYLRRTPA
jgi:putative oxidoreductase